MDMGKKKCLKFSYVLDDDAMMMMMKGDNEAAWSSTVAPLASVAKL